MSSRRQQPTPKQVDGSMSDWLGESTWIGGVSNYSRGEFIYQDYLYDDYGGVTGVDAGDSLERFGFLTRPQGCYRYPADAARYGANCADLFQLRMAADGQNIYFLVWLNTLLVPDSTVIGIAFDTGGSDPAQCKGHTWPFEAGVTTPGTEHVLTLWGTGGAWDDADLNSVGGQVAVSVEENVIEASIPRELLGTLRFWSYAATGLWDAQARTWMEVKEKRDDTHPGGGKPGYPRVFNLAFRSPETGLWFEDNQASFLRYGEVALQIGSQMGDLHLPAQFVDLDNPPDSPPGLPAGYYQRIYRSSISLGEGVAEQGIPARGRTGARLAYHFLGQYQPYVVYVPEAYDGVLLYLHGGFGTPTALVRGRPMQHDLGDLGGNLIVSPLGRGPVGGWVDYSYLDALEVLEDVMSRYPVDRDRVYVSGWSMGGQGSSRLITTRPHLFGASFQIAPGEIRRPDSRDPDVVIREGRVGVRGTDVISDAKEAIATNPGSTIDLYENIRHVPVLFVIAPRERDGNTRFALERAARLTDMGYMYRSYTHPLYGHTDFARPGFDGGYWARERDWLKDRKVVQNPAHVTYKICEAWWRPDISPRLVYDHAYWVSGMRARDTSGGLSSFGKVDAVSHALGGSEPELEHFHFSLPGPPSRYEVEGQDYVWPGQKIEQYNGFEATFENLRTVSFDARAMGLKLAEPVRFHVTSDGTTQLRLVGTWPGVRVTMDGEQFTQWSHVDGGLQLEVPEGRHNFEAAIAGAATAGKQP